MNKILFPPVLSQRFPTISYISQEKVIDIGGSIELECSVQYVREYPVLWYKVDNVDSARSIPLSAGSNLIVKDSRFSLRYDQASSTYTLQVNGPQLLHNRIDSSRVTFSRPPRSKTFRRTMPANISAKCC